MILHIWINKEIGLLTNLTLCFTRGFLFQLPEFFGTNLTIVLLTDVDIFQVYVTEVCIWKQGQRLASHWSFVVPKYNRLLITTGFYLPCRAH